VFNLFGKLREVHSTNLISGLLFMLMGLILVIFGGTGVFNNEDFLGTKSFFYSLQNLLLGWKYANLAGGVALIVFVAGVGYVVWKEIKKKEYKS